MFVEYDTSAQLPLYKDNPSYTIILHDNRKDNDLTESYTAEHYTNVVYAIIDARDNARRKGYRNYSVSLTDANLPPLFTLNRSPLEPDNVYEIRTWTRDMGRRDYTLCYLITEWRAYGAYSVLDPIAWVKDVNKSQIYQIYIRIADVSWLLYGKFPEHKKYETCSTTSISHSFFFLESGFEDLLEP